MNYGNIKIVDFEFLRNADYYYLHKALRNVEIIVPSGGGRGGCFSKNI